MNPFFSIAVTVPLLSFLQSSPFLWPIFQFSPHSLLFLPALLRKPSDFLGGEREYREVGAPRFHFNALRSYTFVRE